MVLPLQTLDLFVGRVNRGTIPLSLLDMLGEVAYRSLVHSKHAIALLPRSTILFAVHQTHQWVDTAFTLEFSHRWYGCSQHCCPRLSHFLLVVAHISPQGSDCKSHGTLPDTILLSQPSSDSFHSCYAWIVTVSLLYLINIRLQTRNAMRRGGKPL